MHYPREVASNVYSSSYFPSNHQMPDDFWVAQGVFPPLRGGGEDYSQPEAEGYPLPNYDTYPEDSPDLQVTPLLTDGSPSEGWSESESLGEVTPEMAAALLYNVWAEGNLSSCLDAAAPLDTSSSAGYVNNDSYRDTIAIEKNAWLLKLFDEQLDESTGEQQDLENVSPQCSQTLSTTYPHPHSQEDDFEFDVNHNLPAYFAPGPASTTCLPHFPTDDFSSPAHPAVVQVNVVPRHAVLHAAWTIHQDAHPPSHGRPYMAQAPVEPNTQQHWGHMPLVYGANSSLTNYAAAAPIMEQHEWHQQIQNVRQPRTLVSQRHHPYPRVRECVVKNANSVSRPIASSSRLVNNLGYSSTATYTLTQPMEPTLEGANDDNEWFHCQWDGCGTQLKPMTYDQTITHFLDHGVLENGKIKECRWKGCCSQSKFPMTQSGFNRHVRETQKHTGLQVKKVRCERCNEEKGSRSIKKHRKVCFGRSEARAGGEARSSSG